MIVQEQTITYHTVTLGALTREGHALAEIAVENAEGEPHLLTLHVPAGLPGEVVTIGVEAPPLPRPGRHRCPWDGPRELRWQSLSVYKQSVRRLPVAEGTGGARSSP